ncbi:hypothetical protein ACJZ2D_004452 [Fusarium nematophilum]
MRPPKQEIIDQIEKIVNSLEISFNGSLDLHYVSKFERLESRIQESHDLLRAVAQFIEDLSLAVGPVADNSDPAAEAESRRHRVEEMRQKLQTVLQTTDSRQFRLDPLCFPFVPLVTTISPEQDPVVGRVKLDTGTSPNWISTDFLDRICTEFERIEYMTTFIGAGRVEVKPIGRITLAWYSENQARSHSNEFLVHDQVPFDAILGSSWILPQIDSFHEAVLPLRHVLTREDYRNLETRQKETDASNEEVIRLQKEQDRAERERKKREKAESRLHSQAPTPRLSRRNSTSSRLSISTATFRSQQVTSQPVPVSPPNVVGNDAVSVAENSSAISTLQATVVDVPEDEGLNAMDARA